MAKLTCPGYRGHPCGNLRDKPTQRYCRQCRADYMRWWRKDRSTKLKALMAAVADLRGSIRPATALTLLLILVGVAGIFALGRACAPRGPISTVVDTVTVPEAIKDRPTPTPPTGISAAIHDTVPVRVEVTREVPDSALVARYAKLAHDYALYRHRMEQRQPGDTTPPPKAPEEVLPPVALRYSGKALTLWLTPSSGRVAMFTTTRTLTPSFTVVAGRGGLSDHRPLVTEDRPWVQAVREVKGCALPTGVALALGAVLFPKNAAPAAGTAGAIALGSCLWD